MSERCWREGCTGELVKSQLTQGEMHVEQLTCPVCGAFELRGQGAVPPGTVFDAARAGRTAEDPAKG